MHAAARPLLLLVVTGCDALDAGKAQPRGELTRDECVQMTIRYNELRNQELGRVNSKEQKNTVDRCMEHGTRAQFECVRFATSASEVARCDERAR